MKKNSKELAYKISNYLSHQLLGCDNYNRKWSFSIYCALQHSICGTEERMDYKYEYKQWGVAHRLRALKSNSTKSDGLFEVFNLSLSGEKIIIKLSYLTDVPSEVQFGLNDFLPSLWTAKNGPDGESILDSRIEAIEIYNAILDVFKLQLSAPADSEQNQVDESFNEDQIIKLKTYFEILGHMKPLYEKLDKDLARSFVTTLMGAGLFYLPHGVKFWNGQFSFQGFLNKVYGRSRQVKDHILPRKKAAKRLLDGNLSFEDFAALYSNEMAPYMYVTPSENNALINYMDTYPSYQSALQDMNIDVFPPNGQEFKSHKEANKFIECLLEIGIHSRMSPDYCLQALKNFRNEK